MKLSAFQQACIAGAVVVVSKASHHPPVLPWGLANLGAWVSGG